MGKAAGSTRGQRGGRRDGRRPAATLEQRSWPVSLGWTVLLVGAGVALSTTVNPLLGRSVHWDWMAGLAPTLFVLAAVALRRRWV